MKLWKVGMVASFLVAGAIWGFSLLIPRCDSFITCCDYTIYDEHTCMRLDIFALTAFFAGIVCSFGAVIPQKPEAKQ